ncbi:MAG: MFS transporter [Bacteroidales bacterium]|nr:MFS transporter [Bacteroidales bacterium]
MNFRLVKGLNKQELKSFKLHVSFSVIDGLIRGALILNEFVFVKSLNGSSYQLSFLFESSVIVLLLSIVFNELIFRSKNKRRLLRKAGFLTHLPMLALLFFPRNPEIYAVDSIYHYIFLFIFFSYYLSYPITLPAINLFLKNAYSKDNFGKLYSISTSIRQVLQMLVIFLFGWLLDIDNYAFTYIMPTLGVLGFISIIMLTHIDYIQKAIPNITGGIISSSINSVKKLFKILKTNKAYFDYEVGFMFYGFAFMSTKAVIILFYYEVLVLNYSSVAFYQNIYNIVAILLLPFFGKLIGKMDPRKFTIYPFLAMAGYILFIAVSEFDPLYFEIWNLKIYASLLVSTIFYGLFFSTMMLSWNIGSSYFGNDEEAGDYQSVHLFLTGIRGIFAPVIGIVLYEWIGFTWTFVIGILMLIVASYYMKWSYNNRNVSSF